MAFGPGVFFLFAERKKRMKSRRKRETTEGDSHPEKREREHRGSGYEREAEVERRYSSHGMRWALAAVGLYLLVLTAIIMVLVLTVPPRYANIKWPGCIWLCTARRYGILIAVCFLAQTLMLVVPARAAAGLQIRRRHIIAMSLTAGLIMAVLVVLGLLSVVSALDRWFMHTQFQPWLGLATGSVFFTAVWAPLFWSFHRSAAEPRMWVRRVTNWLCTAAVLELVVAYGAYMVARKREYYSSMGFIFWPIAAGVAVTLLALATGVFCRLVGRNERTVSRRQRESGG
jgi:hypothetical protein